MRRGYIGPIGDDFPSIFPIMIGLLLFFSSIFITYQNYELKAATAKVMKANLAIGKIVRSETFFDSDKFTEKCELLERAKVNYAVSARMQLIVDREDTSLNLECGDTDPTSMMVGMNYLVVVDKQAGSVTEVVPATLKLETWI